jgi:flagellar assembly protein FliH
MSLSARRLAGTIVTARFDWQGRSDAGGPLLPPARLSGATGSVLLAPVMRDLPSPSAERQEAAEREGFAKGFREGERAGELSAKNRMDPVFERMASTIDEIAGLRSGLMRRAERELVRLALAMAERVLRREIDVDRELLAVMARVAIDRLGENAVATIHLNPADYDAATAGREPEPGKAVETVADSNVPRGGCIVRSSFGTIDAGIDSQIRELSRALLGEDAEEEEGVCGSGAST